MSAATRIRHCWWCKEPATTTVRYGRSSVRIPACALHKAEAERKNGYMPCIIGPRYDAASDDEKAKLLKATKWADRITDAEWKALLGEEDANRYAKSRLKSKGVEWLMALGRIAYLNPELFAEIAEKAAALYEEQIEEQSFTLQTLHYVGRRRVKVEPGGTVRVRVWIEGPEPDED